MTPLDPKAFRQALGSFPSGVTVVTIRGEDGVHGMTASAFSSLSMDPPLVLVCVGHKARLHAHLAVGRPFGISVLAADQSAISTHFAGYAPDVQVTWESDFGATPVIAGAVVWLDCVTHALLDGGDHTILVGRVEQLRTADATPLVYLRGKYVTLA